jgi:hypothetical protein
MTSVQTDPHVAAIRPVVPRTPGMLRGMPPARHAVGASAALPDMRARRLLRLVTDSARQGACRPHGASDRAVHGTRRDVAVVLSPRRLCLRTCLRFDCRTGTDGVGRDP